MLELQLQPSGKCPKILTYNCYTSQAAGELIRVKPQDETQVALCCVRRSNKRQQTRCYIFDPEEGKWFSSHPSLFIRFVMKAFARSESPARAT